MFDIFENKNKESCAKLEEIEYDELIAQLPEHNRLPLVK